MTAMQTKTGDHMSCSVSLAIKFMTCRGEKKKDSSQIAQERNGDNIFRHICCVILNAAQNTCPVEMVERAAGDSRKAFLKRAVRMPVLCSPVAKLQHDTDERNGAIRASEEGWHHNRTSA